MTAPSRIGTLNRRTILKGAAAAAALQMTPPFILSARGETPLRIGFVDPLTGVYAAPAQNEITGARLAVQQINAKGGILGRPIELLVEDSANDVGTGVQKARKLIERDQVTFLIGDVNSGIAQAIAQVSNEKKVLHIVSGGHTDTITGSDCKWNVYRVCNTTSMEANAVAELLFNKYGNRRVVNVAEPWEQVVFNLEVQPAQEPALDPATAGKIHGGFNLMYGPTVLHRVCTFSGSRKPGLLYAVGHLEHHTNNNAG